MPYNLWFEHVIDAYLTACAGGSEWREAVASAEAVIGDAPRKVLTQKDLKQKGIHFSRQHITRKIEDGTFPPPFQLPFKSHAKKGENTKARSPP